MAMPSMSPLLLAPWVLAWLALLIPGAAAQVALHDRAGLFPGAQFGIDVVLLHDLDGDGHADWMAGRGGKQPGKTKPELRVFSGRNGGRLYDLDGFGAISGLFLESLGDVGDVDADGVHDFAFGNSAAKVGPMINAGKVAVFSGATGATLYVVSGVLFFGGFGASLASIGDVDADGVPDFVVGAIGTLNENVWVVSGVDGTLLFRVKGPPGGDFEFGYSTAATGDLDGDAVPDFAVGTHSAARVQYFSGATGALIRTVSGTGAFGRELADLGDIDGDGLRDLLVGEQFSGSVQIISGGDGSSLALLQPVDGVAFGVSVAAAGDVDQDGVPDFLVGDDKAAELRGVVRLYSTRTLRVLHELSGSLRGDRFGASVAGGLDVDADGWLDFAVGAPGADTAQQQDVGRVSLWSGRPHGAGVSPTRLR